MLLGCEVERCEEVLLMAESLHCRICLGSLFLEFRMHAKRGETNHIRFG